MGARVGIEAQSADVFGHGCGHSSHDTETAAQAGLSDKIDTAILDLFLQSRYRNAHHRGGCSLQRMLIGGTLFGGPLVALPSGDPNLEAPIRVGLYRKTAQYKSKSAPCGVGKSLAISTYRVECSH
jgi:hypothetical protein